MRNHTFTNGELYHIFNRGVDKRNIFLEKADFDRFLLSMEKFNCIDPIGSLYAISFTNAKPQLSNQVAKLRLVNIICYCLNPNHYHFVLEQLVDGGISIYMQRLSTGFAQYFNKKYKRSGALCEGKFKSTPIISNVQLLHVSAYVNLNDRVHNLGHDVSRSSWNEYLGRTQKELCEKDIILKQFNNIEEYKNLAESSLVDIRDRKLLLE